MRVLMASRSATVWASRSSPFPWNSAGSGKFPALQASAVGLETISMTGTQERLGHLRTSRIPDTNEQHTELRHAAESSQDASQASAKRGCYGIITRTSAAEGDDFAIVFAASGLEAVP